MNDSKSYGGLSVITILGIVFLILKLCNVIDWNWWLVCLPFIIEIAAFIVWFMIYLIITFKE